MTLRKLRPLPLFLLIMGAYVPLLLAIVFGDWLYSLLVLNGHRELYDTICATFYAWNLLGIPVYFYWRIKLPFELAATLRPELRPGFGGFYERFWAPGLVFVSGLSIVPISFMLIHDDFGAVVFSLFTVAFFVAWMYSYAYTSWLTARLLCTAELDRVPAIEEITPTFGLVMLGVFGAPFLANRYRALEEFPDSDLV